MKSMDSWDSLQKKIFFKKRMHRPWKPALLEYTPEEVHTEEPTIPLPLPPAETGLVSEEAIPIPNRIRQLEQTIEDKTLERNQINETIKSENRFIIGGFLCPRNIFVFNEEEQIQTNGLMSTLAAKEQEIFRLSHELKLATAVEQIAHLEMTGKKEKDAREASEEKALFAIQQAKIAAEKTCRAEQQLNLERQAKFEAEKVQASFEQKNQEALQEIEKRENIILEKEQMIKKIIFEKDQSLKIAEEKAKYALEYADAAALTSKKEADEKIKVAECLAQEKITNIERMALEEISRIEGLAENKVNEATIKIAHMQMQTKQKVEKAQEQIHFSEQIALAAQDEMKKIAEAKNSIELQKRAIEENLENVLKQAESTKLVLENKMEELLVTTREKDLQNSTLAQEKLELEEKLTKTADRLNKVESVIGTEKSLRINLEIKMKETRKLFEEKIDGLSKHIEDIEARKAETERSLLNTLEQVKKLNNTLLSEGELRKKLENTLKEAHKTSSERIAALMEQNKDSDAKKSRTEGNLFNALENVKELKTMMEAEKEQRISLEMKIKNFVEKVYELENLRQKEIEARRMAEENIAILLKQQERLESSKMQIEEQLTTAALRVKELESVIQAEQTLRKNAEAAKQSAEAKITRAIEQASKTVLNVLGASTTVEVSENGT